MDKQFLEIHNPLLREYNALIGLGGPNHDTSNGKDVYEALNALIVKVLAFSPAGLSDNKKEQIKKLKDINYGYEKLWASYRSLATVDYFSKNMMHVEHISLKELSGADYLAMWKAIKDNDMTFVGSKYDNLVDLASKFISHVDDFDNVDSPQKWGDKAVVHLQTVVLPAAKAWIDGLKSSNLHPERATYLQTHYDLLNAGPKSEAEYDTMILSDYISKIESGKTPAIPTSDASKQRHSLEERLNKATSDKEAADANLDKELRKVYDTQVAMLKSMSMPVPKYEDWKATYLKPKADESAAPVEDSAPPAEDSTPAVVEDSTPAVVEDSTPAVVEDSTPAVVEDSTPPAAAEDVPDARISTRGVVVMDEPEQHHITRGVDLSSLIGEEEKLLAEILELKKQL